MVAASAAAAGAVTAATMQQRPCLPADSSSHKLSWAVLSLLCISSVAAQSGSGTAGTVATGPTLTLNLNMNILGDSIVPFTGDKQYAAASSLAGAFSIIIGAGSVQILASSQVGAPAPAPGPSPFSGVRRLLHSPSSRSLLQAATSGEAVTFAVTLPGASSNSLVVTQPGSDSVHQQISGWFTTQMASRGYTVNAAVTSIVLASTSPGSSPPSGSGGGSSNTGAIVGGVVGGLVALALIAVLVAWLSLRRRRQKRQDKLASTKVASASPAGTATTYESYPTNGPSDNLSAQTNGVHESDRSDRDERLVTESDALDSTAPVPTFSRLAIGAVDGQNVDPLLRHGMGRIRNLFTPNNSGASPAVDLILPSLSQLGTGMLFNGEYIIQPGRAQTSGSVVAYGHNMQDANSKVAIKFFAQQAKYQHERLFYETRAALDAEARLEAIPEMLAAFAGPAAVDTASQTPASLVLEAGDFTLQAWLAGPARLTNKAEDEDRVLTLHDICLALDFLHARDLVHGALSTEAVMWFELPRRWKLIKLGHWARAGERVRLHYNVRWAAPEVVAADLDGEDDMRASQAADLWVLGLIAFEVLAGQPLFHEDLSDQAIGAMLAGLEQLPWEADEDFWAHHLSREAAGFVADLLVRRPLARRPAKTAVHSPMFARYRSGQPRRFSANSISTIMSSALNTSRLGSDSMAWARVSRSTHHPSMSTEHPSMSTNTLHSAFAIPPPGPPPDPPTSLYPS